MKKHILSALFLSAYVVWQSGLFACAYTCDQQLAQDILDDYCQDAGAMYDISPELLESICWFESNNVPSAKNGRYVGLCQVDSKNPYYADIDLLDPHRNVLAAADLLATYFDMYEDTFLALDMYAGYGYKYYKNGDCSPYTAKLLEYSYQLEREHGK